MAVTEQRIEERLKAFVATQPGLNLSKSRIKQICTRLAPKAEDDAEEGAIDELIKTFNDFTPLADLAKEDDRVRTLLANQKPTPAPTTPAASTPNPEPNNPTPPPADDMPAWAKAMMGKLEKLESEKTEQTLRKEAETHLKELPALVRELAFATMPKNTDEIPTWAADLKDKWTAEEQQRVNANLGNGATARGTTGTIKEAPKEVTEARAKRLLNI